MQLLRDTKISTKILALLGTLGTLCLAVAFYANSVLSSTDATYSELVDKRMTSTTKLARFIRYGVQIQKAGYASIVLDGNSAAGRANVEMEAKSYEDAHKILGEIEELRPELKDTLADVGRKLDDGHRVAREVVALGARNENAAAAMRMAEAQPTFDAIQAILLPINNKALADASARSAELSEAAASSAMTTLTLTLIGLLAALLGGWFVSRAGITTPINNIERQMRRLADGDTSIEVPCVIRKDELGLMARALVIFRDNARAQKTAEEAKAISDASQARVVEDLAGALGKLAEGDLTVKLENFPGEYRKLEEDFNAAVGALREALVAISRSTGNIHGGSGEISQASDDLSRRTEQQAASLEETAAAMTQITTTVQNSAAGANQANKLVLATQADAQESSKVVSDAVAAMAEIEKSSQEITKIIEVIDKIAFQTNLLALNASVEAAHAGEAGRAFAVVANEVRALAQRSADAAQEIGTLISNSSRQVDGGVTLVGEAGKALGRIIGSVDEVSGLVSQIAMAADQQSSALAQVNTAITEMDKVTQQNAAMVEESNAAARSLAEEATGLARLVGRFDTGSAAEPVAKRTPPKATRPQVRGNNALALQSTLAGAVDDWNAF